MSYLKVAGINHPSATTGGLAISSGGIVTGGGLDYITSSTFSAASTVSVDNCFTSAYENYRIMLRTTASVGTDSNVTFRLRTSSTDATTNYSEVRIVGIGSTATIIAGQNVSGTDDWSLGIINSTHAGNYFVISELFSPSQAASTGVMSFVRDEGSTSQYAELHFGSNSNATAYDGFTILTSGTSFTGTVTVYGYRKA